jgi:hypothetical protein
LPVVPWNWWRLFQPRNRPFWIAVALNILSALLAWIVQNRDLQAWAALSAGGFRPRQRAAPPAPG